jgi:hypothetical protein
MKQQRELSETTKRLLEELRKECLAIDAARRPKAEVLEWPKPFSEIELTRRQAIIDATWERVLAEQHQMEAEVARGCHRGPGDPDWVLR